jgi:hypothetical protein
MANRPLEYRPFEYSAMYSEYIPEAEKMISTGRVPYIYTFFAEKACSATAVELQTNTTAFSVQTGGTHEKLAIDSTNTDDNASGSGCAAALKAWGVDSANNMRVFSTNLSGTTVASGATAMYEINTLYVGSYGTSTQNCKGSCWASMIGKGSQKIVTIKAGQNHNRDCRVWFPKGWRAKILTLHAFFVTKTKSSVDSIGKIFPHYYDAYTNKQYDGSHDIVTFSREGGHYDSRHFNREYGNDTTMGKLTFYGVSPTTDQTIGMTAKIMLWAEPNALASGQKAQILGV